MKEKPRLSSNRLSDDKPQDSFLSTKPSSINSTPSATSIASLKQIHNNRTNGNTNGKQSMLNYCYLGGFLLVTSLASINAAPDYSCGVNRFNNESPLTERIVGGNNSLHGEWPWQISVRLNHPQAGRVGHWCGGTLIDKQWIITAAHCVSNPLFTLPQAMYWEIKLGEFNQKTTDEQEKIIGVSHVAYSQSYRGYDNDIALMKLAEPIRVSEYVRPVCIPDDKTTFIGRECVATGWGKVDNNKKSSNILQKVGVAVYDISECQNSYYTKFKISIDKWHLCAGARDGGKGTCHGDSGGPLQCRVNGKWIIAGITSFGSGCAKPGFPDVYTNVPYFSNWIRDTIKAF